MNKNNTVLCLLLVIISFSSCRAFLVGGTTNGTTTNLTEANFNYVQKGLVGKSTATYIFGFGGLKREGLMKDAKEDLLKQNPLKANQSLANMTVDFKNTFILGVYQQQACIITADIVEFKNKATN
jgi:hypothetical protein